MPYNGSGVYSLVYDWNTDAANGIKIRSDRMMNQETDIAQGLTNCVTKDGQSTPSANLPMGGYKHTNVLNGANRNDYAALGQVQDGKINWVAASGTADAITAFYNPSITTLVDGQEFYVRASGANTITAPTFSPDGLTARTIVKYGGQALAVGDVRSGQELILRYNLANTRYELMNPGPFLGGNLSGVINEAQGANIASAATTDIASATGNYINVTGTTTITALGTVQAGAERTVTFTGVLTLTHNATSLILPTGANITTASGDTAVFRSLGSVNWKCVEYQRADGSSLFGGLRRISRISLTAGQTSQAFTNLILGRNYKVRVISVFGSSNADLWLRTSTNNGSSFSSGATDYYNQALQGTGSTLNASSANSSQIVITGFSPLGTNALNSCSGFVDIVDPMNSSFPTSLTSTMGGRNNTGTSQSNIWGQRNLVEANNAIQILPSTGTFQGGIIELWEEA
jgi:hypothetical protein